MKNSFEKGFLEIIKLIKKNGYFIIHDEFKNHNKKIEFIESNKPRSTRRKD